MTFPNRSDVSVPSMLLFGCLALIYGINLSTPGLLDRAGQVKGADFAQFYVLGSLALDRRGDVLYDRTAYIDHTLELIPETRGQFFLPVYGPQVSLIFAPIALLPYAWGFAVWVAITVFVYVICCVIACSSCPNLRAEASNVIILAAAYPAFFLLVAYGQNSAIALACFTCALVALKRGKAFLAGVAIGSLAYKPQLGLAAACVFLLAREWKIVAGAMVGATAQIGAAWVYYGTSVMAAYWRAVLSLDEINALLEVKLYQMHSLLSFWKMLIPWPTVAMGLYIFCASVLILVAWRVWCARAPVELRFSVLLLVTVLVNPHLYNYDLVVLAPAFLIIGEWTLSHPEDRRAKPIQRMLYFSYVLPLVAAVTHITHLQFSVVAMSLLAGTTAQLILNTYRDEVQA